MAIVNAAHPDFWNPAKYGGHAMILIITCFVWKWVRLLLHLPSGRLQSIPRSLTEAAAMDGSARCAARSTSRSRCSPRRCFCS